MLAMRGRLRGTSRIDPTLCGIGRTTSRVVPREGGTPENAPAMTDLGLSKRDVLGDAK